MAKLSFLERFQRAISAAMAGNVRLLANSFMYSMVARVLQVLLAVLLTRALEPSGYGLVSFAIGVAVVGGRLGEFGFSRLIERFVPRYEVEKEYGALIGLVRASHLVVLSASLTLASSCVLLAMALGRESSLFDGLILASLLVPPTAFRAFHRALLSAFKAPHKGVISDELLPVLLMILFMIFIVQQNIDPTLAVLVFAGSSLASIFASLTWINNELSLKKYKVAPVYNLRLWLRTAFPSLVGSSAKLLSNRMDVLMLAPLSTMSAVGLYGAAMRLSVVQTAGVSILTTVLSPRISEAFAAGNLEVGKRLFYLSIVFALTFSGLLAVCLVIFSKDIVIGLFGHTFADSARVLQILAISQVAASLNTAASSFIIMTGRQVSFGKSTVLALCFNFLINIWLIPKFGAIGAAVSSCASMWFLSAMQLNECRKILKSGEFLELKRFD